MEPNIQPVLLTDRLTLRPYQTDDFAAVHEYSCEEVISQYMAWGPNTEEDTRQFIQHCIDAAQNPLASGFLYVIISTETGELLGGCNLSITDKEQRTAMIGYTLNAKYWRQGFTSEAAAALLKLGFSDLNLHRITSWCTPENIGSWKVMEKIGMRREGHERESVWFKECWHDQLRYAILGHAWRTINP